MYHHCSRDLLLSTDAALTIIATLKKIHNNVLTDHEQRLAQKPPPLPPCPLLNKAQILAELTDIEQQPFLWGLLWNTQWSFCQGLLYCVDCRYSGAVGRVSLCLSFHPKNHKIGLLKWCPYLLHWPHLNPQCATAMSLDLLRRSGVRGQELTSCSYKTV